MINGQAVLDAAHAAWLAAEERVPLVLGRRNLDEVALWTPDAWRASEAIASLVYQPDSLAKMGQPWQRPRYFNRSDDVVSYRAEGGVSGSYGVHYDFLQPYGTDYRLEVMHVLSGSSPAHRRYLQAWSFGEGGEESAVPVHVSYKAPEVKDPMTDYIAECDRLEAVGFQIVQTNQSRYGVFAYFAHPDPEVFPADLYLKPRVNLRDATLRYGTNQQVAR